ncbi:MAG: hypothetical protein NVS4B8_02170 [Herpetosiphon sp.]
MSLSLDTLVRDLAGYLETRLDVSNDVYTLTVPLPQNRHQDVSATVRTASLTLFLQLVKSLIRSTRGICWHKTIGRSFAGLPRYEG